MMDLSDGLASDLRHITRASGVGARIEAVSLPISDAARRAAEELTVDPVHWALHGGEDYQLLFTVPEERFPEVSAALGPLGIVATIVGRVTRGRGLSLIGADGKARPLRTAGFSHFG
jgi:thiamine-monophosphate kinase